MSTKERARDLVEALECMLDAYNADKADLLDRAGRSLLEAVKDGDINECIELLAIKGVDIHIKDNKDYLNLGKSPVLSACENGHLDILKYLVSKGANLNDKSRNDSTCSMEACFNGYLNILDFLVSNGADVNLKNHYGQSCLSLVCDQGHLNVLEFLVGQGANINDKNNSGDTCLMAACYEGHLNVVEYLLYEGANINDKNNSGNTCLMAACFEGRLNIVEYLLYEGANIHEKSEDGDTCFWNAFKRNHIRVLYRLYKWPTTMAILVLQELALIYIIDSESVIDLHQYLGRPEDLMTDDEEDFPKDDEGNVLNPVVEEDY